MSAWQRLYGEGETTGLQWLADPTTKQPRLISTTLDGEYCAMEEWEFVMGHGCRLMEGSVDKSGVMAVEEISGGGIWDMAIEPHPERPSWHTLNDLSHVFAL